MGIYYRRYSVRYSTASDRLYKNDACTHTRTIRMSRSRAYSNRSITAACRPRRLRRNNSADRLRIFACKRRSEGGRAKRPYRCDNRRTERNSRRNNGRYALRTYRRCGIQGKAKIKFRYFVKADKLYIFSESP